MKSKVTTFIDPIDNLKLVRMASRAGMSRDDAVRLIHKRGVAFFLRSLVGATR